MSVFDAARFLASAHELRELPPDVGREVAFAGRSNAGKSSAINALAHRKRLAFVSTTPGRTQTINFFDCGENRRLVDLPGYGYAAVSKTERAHWGRLIEQYLQGRASLQGLVVIADSRHPLSPLDQQLLGWHASSGQPLLVLLTKADKLTRSEGMKAVKRTQAELPALHPAAAAILFSAVDGTGQRHAHNTVAAWIDGR